MNGNFHLIRLFRSTYTWTPAGGSHTHSPVVKLAYMCSLVRGSMISTHSILQRQQSRHQLIFQTNEWEIIHKNNFIQRRIVRPVKKSAPFHRKLRLFSFLKKITKREICRLPQQIGLRGNDSWPWQLFSLHIGAKIKEKTRQTPAKQFTDSTECASSGRSKMAEICLLSATQSKFF